MPRKRRPPAASSSRDSLYPSLDLHGDTADAARARAERWLRDEQRASARTVRIITGKGLHSIGPPVLPLEIEGLLVSLKGSLVADFGAEPGGGSFLVQLRRPPRPRGASRLSSPAPLPDDPVLRLAAEESLAELGIVSTPELLAAEMKRLSS